MELLEWALGALIVAVIAAVLGFGGIARGAASIARVLFGIFILGAVILFILALLGVGVVV